MTEIQGTSRTEFAHDRSLDQLLAALQVDSAADCYAGKTPRVGVSTTLEGARMAMKAIPPGSYRAGSVGAEFGITRTEAELLQAAGAHSERHLWKRAIAGRR